MHLSLRLLLVLILPSPTLSFFRPFLATKRPLYQRRSFHKMSACNTLLPHMEYVLSHVSVVLASKSPRRQEIFGLLGLGKDVLKIIPSDFPEDLDKTAFETPAAYAATNAMLKAKEVAEKLFSTSSSNTQTTVVVGSDTIVDIDGVILEKPDDDDHAFRMLKQLSGRKHYVHSGVAIFSSKAGVGEPVAKFSETTEVTFAPLSDTEIWAYIKTREPFDKAGSYGIQGIGGQMVTSLNGCYFNVMGFPMHHFSKVLGKLIQEGKV